MKKLFIISAAAVLAIVSCTKVEDRYVGAPESREIAFNAIAKPITRAATTAAIADAVYPDNLAMQVSAYSFPSPASTWSAGSYFEKTEFTGTNATSWKGTPARYWPLTDAYVSFLAVAGVDATDVTMNTPYGSTASVVYDADSFTAQTDLMYSGKQEHVAKEGNALTYPDDADMVFQHALAWLQFKVRVPEGASYGTAIAVTKIVINGANKTGTFTITNTGYDTVGDPTPTGSWGSFAAVATDYDVPSSSKATLSNSGFEDCGAALLVPKASPATSFEKFTIYYTINGQAFTFDYTPASLVLAQDTKYVYNITFTLTEIEIDPTVDPWTNADAVAIAVPTPAA